MRKKVLIVLLAIVIFTAGVGGGYYIRNQTLNPKATIPPLLSRVIGSLVQKGEEVEDDLIYHDADLTDFILNGSIKTKVAVEGQVESVTLEPDGDYHMDVVNSIGLPLVTEFIPEIKHLPIPKVGDHIKIWGIVRFDAPHNWWEIHPVIGWRSI